MYGRRRKRELAIAMPIARSAATSFNGMFSRDGLEVTLSEIYEALKDGAAADPQLHQKSPVKAGVNKLNRAPSKSAEQQSAPRMDA